MTQIHKIFGTAGTGKTTYLINKVVEKLNDGVNPSDICYTTFTKSAAQWARAKAIDATGIEREELPYFSNMHSICYHLLDLDRDRVINSDHRSEFCKMHGHTYMIMNYNQEEMISSEAGNWLPMGNRLFDIVDRVRLSFPYEKEPIRKWRLLTIDTGNSMLFERQVLKFNDDWKYYKEKRGLYDFIDMIEVAIADRYMPYCNVQFYDEFQDMYLLLYKLYKMWVKRADEVYISGDPFQCLYGFMSADPEIMLKERATHNLILPKSYRVPKVIWNLAKEITTHASKAYYSLDAVEPADRNGVVRVFSHTEDWADNLKPNTYLLARSWYQVRRIEERLIELGIPYYMIQGRSPWGQKTVGIYHAIYNLTKSNRLGYPELRELILALPVKDVLKRRIKTLFKKDKIRLKTFEPNYAWRYFKYKNMPATTLIDTLTKYDSKTKLALVNAMTQGRRIFDSSDIKVSIGTIHSSKGREADHVILFNNITKRIQKEINLQDKFNEEVRVFFTACTRARESLSVVDNYFNGYIYPLPGVM